MSLCKLDAEDWFSGHSRARDARSWVVKLGGTKSDWFLRECAKRQSATNSQLEGELASARGLRGSAWQCRRTGHPRNWLGSHSE